MRKQNVILSSLIGAYLVTGAAFCVSADDVYVDLSVLSTLRSNDEFVADSAPLFPDIKNAPKTISKRKIHKAKKVVAPKKTVKVEPKPVVAPKPAPTPVVEIKPAPLPDNTTSTEPDLSSESAQVASQPVVENAFVEAKKQADSATNAINADATSVSAPASEPEKTSDTVQGPATSPALLVVPEKETPIAPQAVVPLGDKQIAFAEGLDELTAEHKRKLDAIITSFQNPTNNMIAINSYNYDDGTDVFNKKRLSLRRIVAVRSYLLNRGYKNFMPKVINITDDASKANVVELEEIKN